LNGENTRRVRYLTEADYAVRGLCSARIMSYADYTVCKLCRMQIMPYADYAVRRLCRTQIIQYANYTVCKLCRMRIMHHVHYAYYVRCPRKCAFQKLECTMYRLSDIMFIAVFDKNVRDYTACQGDLYSGKIWKEILDIDKSTSNG
jgi:hypothetical protein